MSEATSELAFRFRFLPQGNIGFRASSFPDAIAWPTAMTQKTHSTGRQWKQRPYLLPSPSPGEL